MTHSFFIMKSYVVLACLLVFGLNQIRSENPEQTLALKYCNDKTGFQKGLLHGKNFDTPMYQTYQPIDYGSTKGIRLEYESAKLCPAKNPMNRFRPKTWTSSTTPPAPNSQRDLPGIFRQWYSSVRILEEEADKHPEGLLLRIHFEERKPEDSGKQLYLETEIFGVDPTSNGDLINDHLVKLLQDILEGKEESGPYKYYQWLEKVIGENNLLREIQPSVHYEGVCLFVPQQLLEDVVAFLRGDRERKTEADHKVKRVEKHADSEHDSEETLEDDFLN